LPRRPKTVPGKIEKGRQVAISTVMLLCQEVYSEKQTHTLDFSKDYTDLYMPI
jgi:hypothetical protein